MGGVSRICSKSTRMYLLRAFRPFDYVVIAIGIIGTLNVLGAFIEMPQPVLVILEALSGVFFCFSVLSLVLNRFVRHLDSQQQRIHLYHIFANLIPTIYVLT